MGRRTKRRIPHLGDLERLAHLSQGGQSWTSLISLSQASPSENEATERDRAWLGSRMAGSVGITIISRASEPITDYRLGDFRLIKLRSLLYTLCDSNLEYPFTERLLNGQVVMYSDDAKSEYGSSQ
jgi:hypothetical protein